MADSEKLTALKKAYADIILNTAKEAAARIMVSERKAQRYQRELFAAKDEALRMLLRLKQMLDSKVSEAEMASLNQQRRIEELEAQLGEAEDIVKDLRSELRELQDELEKVTNSQMQPVGEIITTLPALEDDRFGTSTSAIPSLSAPLCVPVTTLETTNSNSNGACDGNKCLSENNCRKDNCFVFNPDFASIVMRSKEPELYRNGCTQRIRAFERSLLDGNLSLSGQADGANNQVFMIADEEDTDIRKQPTAKDDSVCDVEKFPDPVNGKSIRKRRKNMLPSGRADGVKDRMFNGEEVKPVFSNLAVKADNRCNIKRTDLVKDHGGGIPRSLRRKRAARYRRQRECRSFIREAVDNDVQAGEDSRKADNTSQKDPQPFVVPKSPSNANDIVNLSGSLEIHESEAKLSGTCFFQDITSNGRLPVDELQLCGWDAGAECSEHPVSKTDFEIASTLPPNMVLKEPGPIETVSAHSQSLFKYTFQRKRKKESLSGTDGDTSLDNNTPKKMMGEKQSGSVESDISSSQAESSRDKRRLAQVARQLISLSEKQWQ